MVASNPIHTSLLRLFSTNKVTKQQFLVDTGADAVNNYRPEIVEINLLKQLGHLMRTACLRTTAFHPVTNGLVEPFHRQLKAAIRYHKTERWIEVLSIILCKHLQQK
uniref:Integrase catalytic domain-containing protein n=1 Tax=Clastoptera arizonana TaxID=38151 RepID=A0A1B6C0S8_9HEMI